ncbi:hypothetical protein JAAARDRAFT_143571 [Jaapia argillacea MUCL 33604]|uniref:Uncharacterized protein n=1 Tax=Jaapia argillacea MUCL 33604 TaxID=933084 RepID=A0A067P3P1_9AGAM|nr:hypothetical protein JAAARDRAFT_143571 [Jaapia argillacea MUCL 33604]
MSDTLSHFSVLDELIQLIYQGSSRFVVVSNVDDNFWTVHVGLSGKEGRWWRGRWAEDDILRVIGTKSSSHLLESFASGLADALVQGELHIGDWVPEKGASINLILGPSAKRPLKVTLVELSPEEGAAFATSQFIAIALQAQSRRCRLHPSAFEASIPTTSTLPAPARMSRPAGSGCSAEDEARQEEIKKLRAELAKANSQKALPPKSKPLPAASNSTPRPTKGSSLANPNKKARKFKELEFEDDD